MFSMRSIGSCRPHGCPQTVRQIDSLVSYGCRVISSRCRKRAYSIENAELVNNVLRDYGFNDTDLAKVGRVCPYMYLLNAKKNIQPKLEFFNSIGISGSDVLRVAFRWPPVLAASLKNRMIPSYDYLRNIPEFKEHISQWLKYSPGILSTNVWTCLVPNVKLLHSLGVPLSSIAYLIKSSSPATYRRHDRFRTFVNQLVAMGMNPQMKLFLVGAHALSSVKEETWKAKVKLFKTFGLSNDEILLAFKKQPLIRTLSEKNLGRTMEFFMNQQRVDKSVVLNNPSLLLLSLDKRIMPRYRVLEMLVKKGLEERTGNRSYFLKMNEDKFLERYCYRFRDESSELMKIYSESGAARSKESSPVPSD